MDPKPADVSYMFKKRIDVLVEGIYLRITISSSAQRNMAPRSEFQCKES